MKNFFNRIERAEEKREDERNYHLGRQATAFERFAGEFADTGISYQNINGFILPTAMA